MSQGAKRAFLRPAYARILCAEVRHAASTGSSRTPCMSTQLQQQAMKVHMYCLQASQHCQSPGRSSHILSNDSWLLLATVISYCWLKLSIRDTAVAEPTRPVPPSTTTFFFAPFDSHLHNTLLRCTRSGRDARECVACMSVYWTAARYVEIESNYCLSNHSFVHLHKLNEIIGHE